jgi:hypothetical protein
MAEILLVGLVLEAVGLAGLAGVLWWQGRALHREPITLPALLADGALSGYGSTLRNRAVDEGAEIAKEMLADPEFRTWLRAHVRTIVATYPVPR